MHKYPIWDGSGTNPIPKKQLTYFHLSFLEPIRPPGNDSQCFAKHVRQRPRFEGPHRTLTED